MLRKTADGSVDTVHLAERPLTAVMADDSHVYFSESVNTIPVGMYGVAITDGTVSVFSSSHYVYTAADGPALVVWADYSDRLFAVAK